MNSHYAQYYDELLDLIYLIPTDQSAWTRFAEKIIHILDASYVHIQAIDFKHNVLSFSNGKGPLALEEYAAAELDYLRYPIGDDPRWGGFLAPDCQAWYQCHTHVSPEFVAQSELYQKILIPVGLRFVSTHKLILDQDLCVFWSVCSSEQRQPLLSHELDFLSVLVPHLKRVVLSQRHLYEFSYDHIIGHELIDKLQQPIVLLSLSGQIVHINQAAKLLLAEHPLLAIIKQQLVLKDKHQHQQFVQYLYELENLFRYDQQSLSEAIEQIFELPNKKQPELVISMSLLTSKKQKSFFGIRPLLMLKFYSSRYATKVHLAELELLKVYNLTKKELQICTSFINQHKLEDIAQECSITLSSLRTYLKRIFAKTQTNSQAELVRLLMRFSINYQL